MKLKNIGAVRVMNTSMKVLLLIEHSIGLTICVIISYLF